VCVCWHRNDHLIIIIGNWYALHGTLTFAVVLKPFIERRILIAGIDESVKILESMGGWCRGQLVDISKREEVYKAAAEIKNNFGDVSTCKA